MLFQRPVNGVGQTNGLRRGRVRLTCGLFMHCKLPCCLRKQFLLSNRKCVSACGTSQADLPAVTAWPANPEQAGLTASAVQLWPQTIRLCSVRKLPFCLFCYLFLHLPEGVLVDDGRVSVSSGIAGIFYSGKCPEKSYRHGRLRQYYCSVSGGKQYV